ncbi:MAG: proline dehydrogenase family protein [Actinomycetota bacterium]
MPNRLLLRLARSPAVRRFVTSASLARPVVERFVAGETVEDGIEAARRLATGRIASVLDYLGEHAAGESQANAATDLYLKCLTRIKTEGLDTHISVKLTQLGLDQSFEQALRRMGEICGAAAGGPSGPATMVAIDMESHRYTDRTIEVYRRLADRHENVILCLQAYLKRTEGDLASLLASRPSIRLVKGAYDEPDDLAFGSRDTDASFRRLLALLLDVSSYAAVATHADGLIQETIRLARQRGLPPERFEFQMLYGVRRDLQRVLRGAGHRVRVYIPFGDQWYPYLMRRMAERPRNLRLFAEALFRG